MKVILENPGWKATRQEIHAVEQHFHAEFPLDYVDFLQSHDGAVPEPNSFKVGSDNSSGVQKFIPLSQLIAEYAGVKEELPENVIPIAWAEGGNYVCLELLGSGKVTFWDHEYKLPNSITHIARSFSNFCEQLEKLDMSAIQLKPGQVKSVWVDPDLLK